MLAAPGSRFPLALGVLGAMAVGGALAVPMRVAGRRGQVNAWWQGQHGTLVRAWALAAMAVGAFVVYACGGV